MKPVRRVPIRGLTVCVGYDDFLRLTLPKAIRHVHKMLVITSPADTRTQELAKQYPDNVLLHVTDAFYRNDAPFNKGAAMEEGFDVIGREGWMLIMDADIVLPDRLPHTPLQIGKLYTPRRRILSNVSGLTSLPDVPMDHYPLRNEDGHFGYFQLFHASDPVLRTKPWYATDWRHAGGADSVFQRRWKLGNKIRPRFEVLHLGDPDMNWFGRATPRIDTGEVDPNAEERMAQQKALHRKYGWCGETKTGEPVLEQEGVDPKLTDPCHDQALDRQQRIKPVNTRRYPRMR